MRIMTNWPFSAATPSTTATPSTAATPSAIAAVLLSFSLILAACGNNGAQSTDPAAQPSEDPAAQPPTAAAQPSTARDQASATEPPLAPGDHTIALAFDGRDRSYIVHVPAAVPQPAPVLIALHGGGGTGAGFQTQNGLDPIADREGFIAVYPEGSGRFADRLHTWNSGATCCGYAHDQDVDDVGFLRAILADLASSNMVDPDRVYVTGHSNGAMMAYRFATEASDLVAAIAVVAGAPDLLPQPGAEPTAVLHIHSADDPRAVYEGGEGPPFPGTNRTIRHEPVEAGLVRWATTQNRCDPNPVESEFSATGTALASSPTETATLYRWENCAEGADFQHLLLTGSGHGWPGVTVGRFWQNQLGEPTTIIDASEEVWAFVSRFSRDGRG